MRVHHFVSPSLRLSVSGSPAFTLVELLVVIGIIAIIVGLALPAVNHARHNAQMMTMKANFQSITAALEEYRQDFRDYPRMPLTSYPGNDPFNFPRATFPYYPRIDPTLAMAIVGPGPAAIVTPVGASAGTENFSNYPNADPDGADGAGFKTNYAVVATTSTASGAAGSTSLSLGTITYSATGTTTAGSSLNSYFFTVVSLGGPASPDANIPIVKVSGGSVTLAIPLQQTYTSANASLLVATGKTWGPYIQADKLKVQYFESYIGPNGSTQPTTQNVLPVLLDVWGNPIYYLPAYNAYGNQIITTPMPAGATIGPLLGSPTAKAAADGAIPTLKGASIFWDGPIDQQNWTSPNIAASANNYWFTAGQRRAILYRLGDVNDPADTGTTNPPAATSVLTGMISTNEHLAVQAPYFLMSAGPSGVFTDLYFDSSGNPTVDPHTWAQMIQKSDNIYSFDP